MAVPARPELAHHVAGSVPSGDEQRAEHPGGVERRPATSASMSRSECFVGAAKSAQYDRPLARPGPGPGPRAACAHTSAVRDCSVGAGLRVDQLVA